MKLYTILNKFFAIIIDIFNLIKIIIKGEKMKKATFSILACALMAVSAFANDGEKIYNVCKACHGLKAEKRYQNKVSALNTLTQEQIQEALKEYKEGKRNTYGLGAVMKVQASRLNDESIMEVAKYIKTLK